MDKRNFAFGKINFLLLAIGMFVDIVGLILMSGGGSNETFFDPSVYSTIRIKVAPIVTFVGFVSIIGAIVYNPKDDVKDFPNKTTVE